MTAREGTLGALKVVLGTLVPVAAVGASLYLLYVGWRTDYLTSRNYRAVVAVSGEVTTRLESVRTALETAGRSAPEAADGGACPLPDAGRLECASVDDVALPERAASRTGGRVYLRTEAAPTLYFAYDRRCDRTALDHAAVPGGCDRLTTCASTSARDGGSRRCTRIPAARLLDPLLSARDPFEAFVVTAGSHIVASSPDMTGGLVEEIEARLGKPDAPGEAQSVGARLVATFGRPKGTRTVRVRDRQIYVFSEPLDGTIDVDGGRLELHGLVDRGRFDRERAAIPHRWLVPLVLVVLLGALAWPVLKLWYMGSRERLSGMDVRILVLSVVVGAGMVAFAVRNASTDRDLRDVFDRQLDELAGEIDRELRADVAAAYRELTGVVDGPDAFATRPLAYHDIEEIVLVSAAGMPDARWRSVAGPSGWTLESADVPEVTLTDRRYFQDVIGGRFAGANWATEMVHSRTTGDPALVVAVPTRSAAHPVALATLRLSALRDPVLPYGFGFALLDADGNVQLHSDPHRMLVENFFDEVEPAEALRAAVAARAPRTLAVTYAGRDHRLRVRPLDYLRWSLVVFQDDGLIDGVDEEIVTLWSALFAGWVVALVVVLAVTQIVHDGYRAPWLWPDRTQSAVYAAAFPRVAVAAMVAYRLAAFQWGVARGAMLLCVLAATVGTLCLRLGTRRAGSAEVVVTTPWERRAARAAVLVALATAAALALRVDRAGVPLLAALAILAETRLAWPLDACELLGLVITGVAAVASLGPWPAWIAPAAVAITLPTWYPDAGLPVPMTSAVPAGRLRAAVRARLAPLLARVAVPATEATFRFCYVALAFALLVLIAVLPSIVFHDDARQWALAGLARFGQLDFEHRAAERDARVRAENVARPALDGTGKSRAELYCTSWVAAPGASIDAPDGREPAARLVSSHIGFLHDPVPELQVLAEEHPPIATLALCDAHARDPGAAPATGAPGWRTGIALAWLACGVLGFALLWSVARLVFLLDLDRGDPGAAPGGTRESLGVWTFGSGAQAPVRAPAPSGDALVVDLRFGATAARVEKWLQTAAGKQLVEIDHLESILDDADAHAATLGMIERLVERRGTPIVLVSEVDPIRYLAARVADAGMAATPDGAPADELLARWSRVLDVFTRRRWEVPAAPGAPDADVAKVLEEKYRPLVAADVARDADIDEIGEARYWRIWRECTRAERLALRHLGEEGFLNPNGIFVVRPLVRRLLVRRDPAFSLPSAAFRRFVLRAEAPETIAAWETEETPSAWSRLRTPLVGLSLVVAVYVFLAERDLFDSSVAVAAGITAGLPTVLKLLGYLGDQRAGVRSG